ncbi:MAG: hypothetical protein JRN39_05330 [Nitrososphaerota archaeon]|nr:hypothetical protein [Nitrososphaerota archaeon]MDG6939807.1 hypothetical protein [Nitrososphaerota archaeon]
MAGLLVGRAFRPRAFAGVSPVLAVALLFFTGLGVGWPASAAGPLLLESFFVAVLCILFGVSTHALLGRVKRG